MWKFETKKILIKIHPQNSIYILVNFNGSFPTQITKIYFEQKLAIEILEILS